MKPLLDQALSRRLVAPLQQAFPGTSHVALHDLDRADDATIWDFARDNAFLVATKDEDFQILSFARGHPPKVVLIRTGNGPSRDVLLLLQRATPLIEALDADETRSLLELP